MLNYSSKNRLFVFCILFLIITFLSAKNVQSWIKNQKEQLIEYRHSARRDIKGAKAYFMTRKMLEEKDFDNLFRVKVNSPVKRPYKWWKEESTDLDDF